MELKGRNERGIAEPDNTLAGERRSREGKAGAQCLDGPTRTTQAGRLPFATKLVMYGMCGLFAEVMFTATWYFVDSVRYHHGWKLHGCSSVWSFPIYGFSSFVVEKLFLAMDGKIPLFVRGLIYVVWIYIWEFSTGLVLRQFDACPWNYHGYTYFNVMGLITFDYAPLWYIGCLLLEMIVIQNALTLHYKPKYHPKEE